MATHTPLAFHELYLSFTGDLRSLRVLGSDQTFDTAAPFPSLYELYVKDGAACLFINGTSWRYLNDWWPPLPPFSPSPPTTIISSIGSVSMTTSHPPMHIPSHMAFTDLPISSPLPSPVVINSPLLFPTPIGPSSNAPTASPLVLHPPVPSPDRPRSPPIGLLPHSSMAPTSTRRALFPYPPAPPPDTIISSPTTSPFTPNMIGSSLEILGTPTSLYIPRHPYTSHSTTHYMPLYDLPASTRVRRPYTTTVSPLSMERILTPTPSSHTAGTDIPHHLLPVDFPSPHPISSTVLYSTPKIETVDPDLNPSPSIVYLKSTPITPTVISPNPLEILTPGYNSPISLPTSLPTSKQSPVPRSPTSSPTSVHHHMKMELKSYDQTPELFGNTPLTYPSPLLHRSLKVESLIVDEHPPQLHTLSVTATPSRLDLGSALTYLSAPSPD